MSTSPALPRLAAVARAVGWIIVFGIIGLSFTALFTVGLSYLIYGDARVLAADPHRPTPALTLLTGAATAAGFALATWIVGIRRLGLTSRDLRWVVPQRARGWVVGVLLGGAAAGTAMLLAVPLGGAEWERDAGSLADYAAVALRTAAVLAPAALAEELIFRGVPLVVLSRVAGRVWAVVVLSALFAVAHLANPNPSVTGLINIGLAGVFLSLAFYAPGGLWTAFGAHLGWNATLAALAAPVSGVPFNIPFIDYDPGGPVWLTGGSFGPEGGLTATLAIALACVAAWRWIRKDVLAT